MDNGFCCPVLTPKPGMAEDECHRHPVQNLAGALQRVPLSCAGEGHPGQRPALCWAEPASVPLCAQSWLGASCRDVGVGAGTHPGGNSRELSGSLSPPHDLTAFHPRGCWEPGRIYAVFATIKKFIS